MDCFHVFIPSLKYITNEGSCKWGLNKFFSDPAKGRHHVIFSELFLLVSEYSATMAGIFEMNSFIGKFVNLWKAGRNASLKLDSEAGKASVTLKLDLGHPVPPQFIQPGHLHGRGNARDRRRQRRADARKAAAEVEDNRHVDQAQKVVISKVADKSTEHRNGNDGKGKDETSDNVVQSDLMTVLSDEILYEVEILVTPKCTDEDIMECFTINFGEAHKLDYFAVRLFRSLL